jgi:hypothetical protein
MGNIAPLEIRTLIQERIEALKATDGITMADISRQLGRNPTYLQQFVSKGVPKELDENDRRLLATILKVPQDRLGRPRKARQIYAPPADRISRLASSSIEHGTQPEKFQPWARAPFLELPVFQAVQDTTGRAIVMSRRPFAQLPVPRSMDLSERAYCVVIADDTMAPELRLGSTAIVDPALKAKEDTTCLFRDLHAELHVILVRRIRKITEDAYIAYAHNGAGGVKPKDQVLPKSSYDVPHVIVGNIFRII